MIASFGKNDFRCAVFSAITTILRWRSQSAPSAENTPFRRISAVTASSARVRRNPWGRSRCIRLMVSGSDTTTIRTGPMRTR